MTRGLSNPTSGRWRGKETISKAKGFDFDLDQTNRQLGDIRRNPPRLIAREHLGRRVAARFVLEGGRGLYFFQQRGIRRVFPRTTFSSLDVIHSQRN